MCKRDTIEKDPGRFWTRRYTWINDVSWMDKSMCQAWKKLGGVGMIESVRQIGDEISVEHRYAIGSSGVQTVEMFAKASRSHWGIENRLHWTLDVVCLLYTSDAADERSRVDLGGRPIL